MPSRIRDLLGLVGFVSLTLGVAAVGGWVTRTSVGTWYQTLAKAPLNPPDWVFAPVWTTLFVLMGIAAWRVWRRAAPEVRRTPLRLFAFQLALNLLWSVLFFGARAPGWALVEILPLWLAIAWTAWAFRRVDAWAGWLFAPYLLWVTFAVYLNAGIVRLN